MQPFGSIGTIDTKHCCGFTWFRQHSIGPECGAIVKLMPVPRSPLIKAIPTVSMQLT